MYNKESSRDKGTLHAVRNVIDAQNVSDDPHNKFYASSEFADKVLDAYLTVGAMTHHGMESVDDTPKQNVYEGAANDEESKRLHVQSVINTFVEEHIVNQLPEVSSQAPVSNTLKCRFCGKTYIRPVALRNHEEKIHSYTATVDQQSTSVSSSSEDRVYNYTHQTLILLMLRLNHNDAIKLGDGERIVQLYKFFCLFFKISQCPKYAIATLHLQAQVNCLLSPRLSHSLVWNRTVNSEGKADTNYPMDLAVEHDNKSFKADIHTYKGEITDKSIFRISHSTEPSEGILKSYDRSTRTKKPSGRHSNCSTEQDVLAIVEHLLDGDVYQKIPGRNHAAFPKMPHNLLDELDPGKFKSWISTSLKTFSKKHFYRI